jgi:hypothetical protein
MTSEEENERIMKLVGTDFPRIGDKKRKESATKAVGNKAVKNIMRMADESKKRLAEKRRAEKRNQQFSEEL